MFIKAILTHERVASFPNFDFINSQLAAAAVVLLLLTTHPYSQFGFVDLPYGSRASTRDSSYLQSTLELPNHKSNIVPIRRYQGDSLVHLHCYSLAQSPAIGKLHLAEQEVILSLWSGSGGKSS